MGNKNRKFKDSEYEEGFVENMEYIYHWLMKGLKDTYDVFIQYSKNYFNGKY